MSADLHVHVCKNEKEEKHALPYKQKTFWSSEIGPGYREYLVDGQWIHEDDFLSLPDEEQEKLYALAKKLKEENNPTKIWRDVAVDYDAEVVDHTENVWIGEVSWLKAALFEDGNTYIPDTIGRVSELIEKDRNSLTEITDELIQEIGKAFSLNNSTTYHIAKKEEVVNFLKRFKGKKCFTISW